ncbi:hypothetical protein [Leptolyngbya sp. Cla-17]|uniref:hypothetical protein n=1 Tax=Leptolyngbya sp. Cla-17 TaxID=2803751 RepID=UPI001F5CE52B|nr:hypothetical protein [Leptolyngbya sp. Cla-17]
MAFSGSFPIGQFLPQGLIDLGADWLYFRKRAALAAASVLPMVNPMLIDALRCSFLHQEMPGWKEAIRLFYQKWRVFGFKRSNCSSHPSHADSVGQSG